MASTTYKLELKNSETDEKVDFGPRRLGDIGRDILIVKRALGAVVDYQSLVDSRDNNPSLEDPDGWFDCIEGTKVSDLQAATFDSNMETYLRRFQLDNQFYILSYIFTKITVNQKYDPSLFEPSFSSRQSIENMQISLASGGAIPILPAGVARSNPGVAAYLNSSYVSTQMDLITRIFEVEFGTLGEATLAVLHGWLPRTSIGATSYYHDTRSIPEFAYDAVLWGLYKAFQEGLLTQKLEDSQEIEELLGRPLSGDGLRLYLEQAPLKERVLRSKPADAPDDYVITENQVAGIKYNTRTRDFRSTLYSAFINVTREQPLAAIASMKSKKSYSDSLRRAFEPDPLIDPDPYILDSKRIGFFNATDYTLNNLPPFLPEDPTDDQLEDYTAAIRELEDQALTEVLNFYGKPQIWYHLASSQEFTSIYDFSSLDIVPEHDGSLVGVESFCLTTNTTAEKYEIQNANSTENYNKLEYDNGQQVNDSNLPLIKFVEFRTPSLRPGDVYRAKFEIDREKFALISEGADLQIAEETAELAEQLEVTTVELAPACESGEEVSEEDLQRRYEEYKALASQRKREIARSIREKTLENYNNERSAENASVDLGVFGNASLVLDTDSYEFTTGLLSTGADLITGRSRNDISGVTKPSFANFSSLTITFRDLESSLKKAGTNLAKAYENCRQDKIKIKPSDFNGNSEKDRLNKIPSMLKRFISRPGRNKKFNFGTNADDRLTLSGLTGTGLDQITFEFGQSTDGKGLKITKLTAGGKKLSIKNLEKEVPVFKQARTVGYLAQVREMSDEKHPFFMAAGSSCADIGIGKKGLAYIVKHTMSITGEVPDEFNPINQWTKENITDPIERWKDIKKKNLITTKLKVEFGTDDILNVFGEQCKDIAEFMDQFGSKFSIPALLCDYLKCIKLPAVNFSKPDFKIPEIPDLETFGWYKPLINFMLEKWNELLTQFLCTLAKTLLDVLTVPFCAEQLRDQLYGSGSSASPLVKKALVDGLIDISIKPENVDKSKQMIDEMALFLTGEELCRVLQGEPIDAPTMNMILRLAERLEIDEIDTEDSLRNFFETISIFLPEGFCENLNQSTSVIGSATCEETSSLLDQIRRRMLASDATDEEIEQAVSMARDNLLSQSEAIRILGEEGLNGIVPTTLDFGNPEAVISALPPILSEQITRSAKSLFESAKMGYVASLAEFGPSLFLQSSRLPAPTDPEYNQESSVIVQTILENLKHYAALGESSPTTENLLTEQLAVLYQVYELETHTPTIGEPKKAVTVYGANGDDFMPQQRVKSEFSYLNYEARAAFSNSQLFLSPAGILQNGFYYTNDDGVISNRANPIASTRPQLQLLIDNADSPLNGFSFVGRYKMVKFAVENEVISEQEGTISFVREKISERLTELQNELQVHMENIATPISESSYLKILRDFLNFSYENERERRSRGYPSNELIDASINERDPGRTSRRGRGRQRAQRDFQEREASAGNQVINLQISAGTLETDVSLYEFKSTEQTNKFDPYVIEIKGSPLFAGDQKFEYCDTIPGPGLDEENITVTQSENRYVFENAITNIPPNLYTRKELFARKFWDSVIEKVDFIYDEDVQALPDILHRGILNTYLNNDLREHLYGKEGASFSEGIFEQIFFSLRDSRIYDEEGYYPELKRRVNGEAYFSEEEGCYKNRYNVSQFGILSFEKIITDELADQISKELAKPENNLYNLNIDDSSPIEKAIQNVCLIGFIRVCIIELILKGSLAYSVWDVESVADEPFMQDFVLRFVESEIVRNESMKEVWEEVITRVTGIEQPKFALRDVIQKEFIKVQGVSKKIFQNPEGLDYYNWFVHYFVPQSEVSRNIANRDTAGTRGLFLRRGRGRDRRRVENGFQGQTVDERGSIVGTELIEIEGVPDKFYWDHPLADARNVTEVENSFNQLRNPGKLANDLLNGSNPFFHMEHLLEVTGPLAQLETLVLPAAQIIDTIINADTNNPEHASMITNVLPLYRDVRRLNVRDAYARLANLQPFPEPGEYGIRGTPTLPESSRGSSVETEEDINRDHEVYHIDDFVDGLNSVINASGIEKYFLHLRGLMHYDENPADAPGGMDRNTSEPAANAHPETIRRTPTRFITRKRRIISFENDFVSHNSDELFNPDTSLSSYKNQMFQDPQGFMSENNEAASSYFSDLSQHVNLESEDTKYYVLSSNGEELLNIQARGINLDMSLTEDRFITHLIEDNKLTAAGDDEGLYVDHTLLAPFDNQPETIAMPPARDLQGTGRNIRKILDTSGLNQNLDRIDHSYTAGGPAGTVFQNRLGTFDTEMDYTSEKNKYENPHEETWVETVYDFRDDASIIAGLHGSFSIGETFDPAVLNFQPSQEVKDLFNVELRSTITSLYGAAGYTNAQIAHMADAKLTQYGRTFHIKSAADDRGVYLSRPMGIDRLNNQELTQYWLADPSIDPSFKNATVSALNSGGQLGPYKSSSRKMMHNSSFGRTGQEQLEFNNTNLLPPNFYKIPMRVLITQIYHGDEATPAEVYCKVVPPKYIRDMHDPQSQTQTSQIAKLNYAIRRITEEYIQFVRDYNNQIARRDNATDISSLRERRSDFPDFTTDFVRDHAATREDSHVNLESNIQYCSIEGVYSRLFREETEVLAAEGSYNTETELDELFRDRGSLMIARSPVANAPVQLVQNLQNQRRDNKHYFESCNYFYSANKDLTLADNNPENQRQFHQTVFSLNNIFQWYLRTRRSNTLWGQLTPDFTLLKDENGRVVRSKTQQIPLAQSYSDTFQSALQAGHGVPERMDGWLDLTYTDWGMAQLPGKDIISYDEGNGGAAGINTNGDLQRAWNQPGFVTLYPGGLDVRGVPSEAYDSNAPNGFRARLNKDELSSWNFYQAGGDGPGLISDGPGYGLVNYNRLESIPIKNTGTSLFYGEGIVSQVDISSFIKTVVQRLIIDSYDPEEGEPIGDPYNFLNLSDFFSANDGQNFATILGLVRNEDVQFNFSNFIIFNNTNPQTFNSRNLDLDLTNVNRALTSLEHMTRRLFDLATAQAAFCVKSEAADYNSDILEAPYRFAILHRLINFIKTADYPAEYKLILLAVASILDLSASAASTVEGLLAEGIGNVRGQMYMDELEDDDLVDWAVACLHFLGSRLLRGEFQYFGNQLGQELAGIFTTIYYDIAGNPDGRLYRQAPSKEAGIGNRAENVRHIGGSDERNRPMNAQESWDNVKGMVLDQARHGLSVKDIIKKTNFVYHLIALSSPAFPEGTAGETYANNVLILEALLDRSRQGDHMLAKYSDLYRSALSEPNTISLASASPENPETVLTAPAFMRSLLDSGNQISTLYGDLGNFVSKLDYRLFFQLFGSDADASRESFSGNASWIINQLSRYARQPIAEGEKVSDYWRRMMPNLLHRSIATGYAGRTAQLANSVLESHIPAVETLRTRWNTQFGTYTGITSEFLSEEILRKALVNGQVMQGLLQKSTIDQVVRLVANTFIPTGLGAPVGTPERFFRDFVEMGEGPNGTIKEISEEFRSFYMAGAGDQKVFSVPMAEYRKSISGDKQTVVDCFDLSNFRRDYKRQQPWMAEQLIESNEVKQIFQYIFPVKRYQAVSTAFATSTLAGYSTMPSVMQAPKASLAALMNITSMSRKERTEVFDNLSQGEFFKQMTNNTTSNPKGMDCFAFPYPADFLNQFLDMLEQLFKEFPSIFFRGIANAVDPAYKEMKIHWDNCDINNLTWSGVQWNPTIDERNMTAGLMGTPDGNKDSKYAMLLPSAPIDITVGAVRIASNPFSRSNWKAFGRAIERLTGYIYKGPIALVDGAFNFSIPCADIDLSFPGQPPSSWNLDRYGHPISPLTAIALSTPELKGEKRLRTENGCPNDPAPEIEDDLCENSDVEPPPFGNMPAPEEE